MKTLKITPGTVLAYVCEFTQKPVIEVFDSVAQYGSYQMASCAAYDAEEILKMDVLSGEVLELVEEGKCFDAENLEELLSEEYIIANECLAIINDIGLSLFDATDEMVAEYHEAKARLKTTGYRAEVGRLIKV